MKIKIKDKNMKIKFIPTLLGLCLLIILLAVYFIVDTNLAFVTCAICTSYLIGLSHGKEFEKISDNDKLKHKK